MRAVINDTRYKLYCGPMAIAAVTGASPRMILDAFRHRRGKNAFRSDGRCKGIRGTSHDEVRSVMLAFGCPVLWHSLRGVPNHQKPTLAGFLSTFSLRRATIIMIARHWIAVDRRFMIDTHTDGKPIELADAPHRRARVHGYFERL